MTEIRETCYDHDADFDYGCITTNEGVWIRKIIKLSEEYPDQVLITKRPEDNQSYLVAQVPKSWFVIRPPKKMNLSEEQKDALRDRMAKAREKRKEN